MDVSSAAWDNARNGSHSSLPMLHDNGDDCLVLCGNKNSSGMLSFFKTLSVGPSKSGNNSHFVGEMKLCFFLAKIEFPSSSSCTPSGGGNAGWKFLIDETVEPYKVPVTFMKDDAEGKQLVISKLQAELSQLTEEFNEIESMKISLQEETKKVDSSIKRLLSEASSNLAVFKKRPNDIDVESLSAHKSTLNQQVNDMRSVKPVSRKAVLCPYPNRAILAKYKYEGLVAELGFVDDEFHANLLSWVGEQFMDCIVVDDIETAGQLCKQDINCCSLDSYRSFTLQGVGSRRSRSEAEMRNGQLPLPSLQNVPGNPQYLINLIKLQPQNEGLRDTLFYHMYKDSLLFDSMETALSYKKRCIQQNQIVGNLYTRQGDRILSNGILISGKSAKLEDSFGRLRCVFGQYVPDNQDEITELERDIQILTDIELEVWKRIDIAEQQQAATEAFARQKQIAIQINKIKDKLSAYGVGA
jgi:chromosome segregation ATPase